MSRFVVAFGNPLLDVRATLADDSLLRKYGFEPNSEAEIPPDAMDSLLEDVRLLPSRTVRAGGSAGNSCSALAALGVRAALVGAVAEGDDDVEARFRSARVVPGFQRVRGARTGVCACLALGASRTLVADVGAARRYSLDRCEYARRWIDECDLAHVEGFFLSERFDACRYVVERARRSGKPLSYNLGSPYVTSEFGDESRYMAESADLVFGNAQTYESLAAAYEASGCESAAEAVRASRPNKIVVVTDGAHPVLALWGDERESFPVPRVEGAVDTTGAGDAFLAGFVAAHLDGRPVPECVRRAVEVAARAIIAR